MSLSLAIFDIDGTLCDTVPWDDACFGAAVSNVLKIPVGPSSWEGAPHITDAGITEWLWQQSLHRAPTADELEALVTTYASALIRELQSAPHRCIIVPGVPALLDHLVATQWDIAIATGGWSRTARLKLAAAHIPATWLLGSSDDSQDRAEIFRLAQRRAASRRKASHARTVLVGDGTWDVRVAAAHGWGFLGVGQGDRAKRLVAEGASAVVEDFSDLPLVLDVLQHCSVPEVGKTQKAG